MEIRAMNMADLTAAIDLAHQEYESERIHNTDLYSIHMKQSLEPLLTYLIDNQRGMAAVEAGKLKGFLAFYPPFDGLNGNAKGVFSPLGGNAFSGENKGKLASLLFEASSAMLLKEGVTSFAICRYAHDEETAKSFILNGFGIRCMDAICDLSQVTAHEDIKGISYCELEASEFSKIKDLTISLVEHLYQSPVYLPTDLAHFMSSGYPEDTRIFVAKVKEECIAYIKLSDEGENFITSNQKMMNISGAFVRKEYRGKKVADALLTYVQDILIREKYEYLGVDCETLNPTALRFWTKHFKPYTYSYARRIDERVIGYDKYFHDFIQDN